MIYCCKGPQSDELENFLADFIVGELTIELEDGSEKSVASNLKKLWIECNQAQEQEGSSSLSLLQEFETMAAKVSKTKASQNKDDESSSGSDGEGDSEDDQDKMEVTESSTAANKEPIVDDDGFELVQRRRR